MVEFTAEPETVADLDRMLGLADEVVRHKVVRLPDKSRPPAPAAGDGACGRLSGRRTRSRAWRATTA